MLGRVCLLFLLFHSFFLCGAAWGQEQELLQGQAGLYPLRAYLSQPAAVGPAHLVVELGQPKELFKLPEGRHTPPPGAPTPTPEPPRELAVSVVMEMPDMISVKPNSVKLKSVGVNRFEGDVLITMKGDWRLQFVVQTPEGEFRPLARFKVGASRASAKTPEGGLELCDPDASEAIPLKIRNFPDPARVGANRLRIELPENTNVPVMVGADMPGLALGIPPCEATRQEDGSYEAVVDLPMAGYWQVRVDLNGRALPPFALTVEAKRTHGPSRTLLPIVALGLVPALLFLTWRNRRLLKPLTLGAVALLAALGLGAAIEALWPSRHSSSMEMDMFRFDMGMGHLSAPLPVLEAKLEKTRFVTTRDYAAIIEPAKTSVVPSPTRGAISALAEVGAVVSAGDPVAKVGAEIVRAPRRAVVVKRFVDDGSSVEAGAALVLLGDTNRVAVRSNAPISDHGSLSLGMPVDVVGADGERARGKLTFVSAAVGPRGLAIAAEVDNSRPKGAPQHSGGATAAQVDLGLFALGQRVTLKVEVEGPRSTISVPREAVRETADGGARVFLVSQIAGKRVAREQKVTLGATNETHLEVLSGLSAGQTIVGRLEPSLQDGDVVVRATLGEGVFRSLVVPGEGSH